MISTVCHSPASEQETCRTRESFVPRIGVHVFEKLHFDGELRRVQRIDIGIELRVCAAEGPQLQCPNSLSSPPNRICRRGVSPLRTARKRAHNPSIHLPPRAGQSLAWCRRLRPSGGRRRRRNFRSGDTRGRVRHRPHGPAIRRPAPVHWRGRGRPCSKKRSGALSMDREPQMPELIR